MAKNNNLHKAKTAKNDEFYTQLTDIEKVRQQVDILEDRFYDRSRIN